MNTRVAQLKKAIDLLMNGYRRMNDDLESGIDSSVVKERQNALYDEIMDEVKTLSAVEEPDMVILLNEEGNVVNVFSGMTELRYTIAVEGTEYDPELAELYESETFANYKGLVAELNGEELSEEA